MDGRGDFKGSWCLMEIQSGLNRTTFRDTKHWIEGASDTSGVNVTLRGKWRSVDDGSYHGSFFQLRFIYTQLESTEWRPLWDVSSESEFKFWRNSWLGLWQHKPFRFPFLPTFFLTLPIHETKLLRKKTTIGQKFFSGGSSSVLGY